MTLTIGSRRPDGTVAWISDRGYVQRDDHGQVIMKSGVASDITGASKPSRPYATVKPSIAP